VTVKSVQQEENTIINKTHILTNIHSDQTFADFSMEDSIIEEITHELNKLSAIDKTYDDRDSTQHIDTSKLY
jgi:hypothetical protein